MDVPILKKLRQFFVPNLHNEFKPYSLRDGTIIAIIIIVLLLEIFVFAYSFVDNPVSLFKNTLTKVSYELEINNADLAASPSLVANSMIAGFLVLVILMVVVPIISVYRIHRASSAAVKARESVLLFREQLMSQILLIIFLVFAMIINFYFLRYG
jgi:hypothetical protein